ncbi:MAG: hypothetical protein WBC91_19760 [Phototrophicaceae bacterium]
MTQKPLSIFKLGLAFPNVILLITLIILVYTFFPQSIETGGDALFNWENAKRLANEGGDLGTSHHALRWFSVIIETSIISIAGESPNLYYAGPLISMTLFLIIFSYLIDDLFGWVYVGLFLLATIFSIQLWRQTFQILPTQAGLTALSLFALCYYFHWKTNRWLWFIVAVIALFLFYGAKFPHAFFFPGFVLALLLQRKYSHIVVFFAVFGILFGIETILINQFNSGQLPFGRLQGLFSSSTRSNLLTLESYSGWTITTLLSRWENTTPVEELYYLLYFLVTPVLVWLTFASNFFPKAFTQNNKIADLLKNPYLQTLLWMGISFAVCITFFVVSINPLRPGLSMRPRYIAILLPFVFINICWFIALIWESLFSEDRIRVIISSLIIIGSVSVFSDMMIVMFNPVPYLFTKITILAVTLLYYGFVIYLLVSIFNHDTEDQNDLSVTTRFNQMQYWYFIWGIFISSIIFRTITSLLVGFISGRLMMVLTILIAIMISILSRSSLDKFFKLRKQHSHINLFKFSVNDRDLLILCLWFLSISALIVYVTLTGKLLNSIPFKLMIVPIMMTLLAYEIVFSSSGNRVTVSANQQSILGVVFTVIVIVTLFYGSGRSLQFPIWYDEIPYTIWNVDEYFITLENDVLDDEICVITSDTAIENSLRSIMPTSNNITILPNSTVFNGIDMTDIEGISQQVFNQNRVNVNNSTCACQGAVYYGNYDAYYVFTASETEILNQHLVQSCTSSDLFDN